MTTGRAWIQDNIIPGERGDTHASTGGGAQTPTVVWGVTGRPHNHLFSLVPWQLSESHVEAGTEAVAATTRWPGTDCVHPRPEHQASGGRS